jgi:Leucine-rich repeat (LRR) protein
MFSGPTRHCGTSQKCTAAAVSRFKSRAAFGYKYLSVYTGTEFALCATRVQMMDCSSMGLYEVPREVCRITQLRKLNLSDNNIAILSPELSKIINLETLNLSENMLRTFPLVLCDLTLMGDLNISKNPISSLPPQIGRLTVMRRLGLEGLSLLRPAPEVVQLRTEVCP